MKFQHILEGNIPIYQIFEGWQFAQITNDPKHTPTPSITVDRRKRRPRKLTELENFLMKECRMLTSELWTAQPSGNNSSAIFFENEKPTFGFSFHFQKNSCTSACSMFSFYQFCQTYLRTCVLLIQICYREGFTRVYDLKRHLFSGIHHEVGILVVSL